MSDSVNPAANRRTSSSNLKPPPPAREQSRPVPGQSSPEFRRPTTVGWPEFSVRVTVRSRFRSP
eukprot:570984-Rhodomonas_salina.2